MQLNICKSCGGDLERIGNYTVCKFCGSKWVIDADQDVHVIDRANAWAALRDCDFEHAAELFENIIFKEPENHEAYWGRALANAGIMYVTDYSERKKVPTCNSISESSFIEGRDVKKAIELAPADIAESYTAQARQIEAIRVEWVNKASREPAYDVFISYKDSDREQGIDRTTDSINAQELYMALTEAGYKVFFSRVSLRNKVSEHYEPYIYNAIKTAKVMIVYGEKPEYFTAVWVKNEWMRFRARIEQGEKHPHSLVVVCKDVNPADLPVSLRSRQCLDASSISFLEVLKHHIATIVREPQKNAPPKAAPTPPPTAPVAPSAKTKGKTVAVIGAVAVVLGAIVGVGFALIKQMNSGGTEETFSTVTMEADVLPEETTASGLTSDNEETTVSAETAGSEEVTTAAEEETAPPEAQDAGVKYRKISGSQEAEVVGFTPGATEIVINDTFEGLPVTRIAQGAFRSTGVEAVTVPPSVTVIDIEAFQFCEKLRTVTCTGEGLTTVMANAFEGCSALTQVSLPDSVQKIENSAFYGCDALIENQGGVHYVGNCVIGCDDDATSVTLREGTRLIADSAFSSCMMLGNVSMPQSVEFIGASAFEECQSMEAIVIPNGVTAIGEYTFIGCTSLRTVSFGSSVRTIGDSAFLACESLSQILYGGSSEDWERMDIADGNDVFDVAEIVYGGK